MMSNSTTSREEFFEREQLAANIHHMQQTQQYEFHIYSVSQKK